MSDKGDAGKVRQLLSISDHRRHCPQAPDVRSRFDCTSLGHCNSSLSGRGHSHIRHCKEIWFASAISFQTGNSLLRRPQPAQAQPMLCTHQCTKSGLSGFSNIKGTQALYNHRQIFAAARAVALPSSTTFCISGESPGSPYGQSLLLICSVLSLAMLNEVQGGPSIAATTRSFVMSCLMRLSSPGEVRSAGGQLLMSNSRVVKLALRAARDNLPDPEK